MRIMIAGDFSPKERITSLIEGEKYKAIFGDIRQIVAGADCAIVNFESTIADATDSPISKNGPNLRCPSESLQALKYAGFNVLTLANNHFSDYGDTGINNSLAIAKDLDLKVVGGGINIEDASKNLYIEINGKTLCIINCCEKEFNIATNNQGGSNPLNPIKQFYAIQEAKQKSHYILVIVHGGSEHYNLPTTRMQDTYRFFIDAGADAVVNHHQHCFSGYEIYQGKPIFYGLGNFCFDYSEAAQKHPSWNYGVLLEIDTDGPFRMIPILQCAESPSVKVIVDQTEFEKTIKDLNKVIADRKALESSQEKFYASTSAYCKSIFETNWHGIIFPIKEGKWNQLKNYILCDSHRDELEWLFEHK